MSKKQVNLHSFFQIRPEKSNHRKYFIYDPEHFRAFFGTEPLPSDKFIIRKSGIQLYYRPFSIQGKGEAIEAKEKEINDVIDLTSDTTTGDSSTKLSFFPHERSFASDIRSLSITASNIPVPLHKSNLQKAIRKGKKEAALFSAWALLHLDRMELLRRLPIIMVEDVTLFDRSPILIWLMMATASTNPNNHSSSDEQYYTMTEHDARMILAMVQYLAEQTKVSYCAQMHDKEVLLESSTKNIPENENENIDEKVQLTMSNLPDRSTEEELISTIDQEIGVTTSLATTAEAPVDYRHLSHEDMENSRLQHLLLSLPKDNLSTNSILIDCLLALFYRIKYGGMSGDMELLTEVVDYFRIAASSIISSTISTTLEIMPLKFFYLWQSEPRNLELSLRPCHLLPEAIDYHPQPQLITRIHTRLHQQADILEAKEKDEQKFPIESFFSKNCDQTSSSNNNMNIKESIRVHFITPERIKELIWWIDSAPNIRRPKTLKMAQSLTERAWEWKKYIAPILQKERRRLLEMYTTSHFSSNQIDSYIHSIGANT